jgi:serine/threonine-protein kinase
MADTAPSTTSPSDGATSKLVPGSWLDRYELLAPIAEGGFGQVWLARLRGKRGFEKLVAIKVPRLSGDVHVQEMLLDEARIASSIEHDNVAKILELGEQGEILYIVMEWIDGEPVSTLLRALSKRREDFPLSLALRIITDMCSAAHAAHELRGPDGAELGVVHRDISPQNMLITSTGNVKLIDFGIAKARDRASGDTTDGTLKGKIKYMAPEQALGKGIDRRADVFALGAVLYRLLCGRAPFEAENDIATLHQLAYGEPAPLPEGVPDAVCDVLERALAMRPEHRFATALEMHDALADAMTSLGILAGPADLARFTEEHLREKIDRRRRTIELALKAAADRAIMAASGSVPVFVAAPISSSESLPPPESASGSRSHSVRIHSAPPSSSQGSGATSGRMFALDVGPVSGHPEPAPFSPEPSKLRWLWATVLLIGAAGVAIVVFVVARSSGVGAAAAPPPPTPAESASVAPSAVATIETPPASASAAPAKTASSGSASASSSARAFISPPRPVAPPHAAPPVARPPPRPQTARPSGTTDFGY